MTMTTTTCTPSRNQRIAARMHRMPSVTRETVTEYRQAHIPAGQWTSLLTALRQARRDARPGLHALYSALIRAAVIVSREG